MKAQTLVELVASWRLREARITDLCGQDELNASELDERIRCALCNLDAGFFCKLAATVQRESSRKPWYPKTTLEKIRLAYRSFAPEIEITAGDVRDLAGEVYDLKLSDREWSRVCKDAGLSFLPNRTRGKAKKGSHRK